MCIMLFYVNAEKDTIFASESFLLLIRTLWKISRIFTVKLLPGEWKPSTYLLWTLGTVIQKLTEQVGKSLSNYGNKNKPAGGVNVAQAFIKKEEVKELKVFLLVVIIISLNIWTIYICVLLFFMLETILKQWITSF